MSRMSVLGLLAAITVQQAGAAVRLVVVRDSENSVAAQAVEAALTHLGRSGADTVASTVEVAGAGAGDKVYCIFHQFSLGSARRIVYNVICLCEGV